MLKEFTLLNANCDLFSQVVLCFSQQQKKLGMQPCMNLGSSLETGATLTLVPRQSQVEFVHRGSQPSIFVRTFRSFTRWRVRSAGPARAPGASWRRPSDRKCASSGDNTSHYSTEKCVCAE